MADISDKLDQIAEQFAGKVDLATSELVSYLRELVKGKTAAQSLEILSGINLEKAYELKLAKAFTAYEAGITAFLQSTFTTASLPESSIRALLNITKASVRSNLGNISSVAMHGIIDGIATGKTVGDTLLLIKEQIPNPELVVNTAYSQFSNSLTTMLADELPENTKWIYIGANDAKTRERCREKIAYSGSSGKTQQQILNRFGDMNNEIWRCRHRWTQRGIDPEAQDFNEQEFVE